MAAPLLAESEKTYLDEKRLRLFCVNAETTIRAVERKLQLGRGNLHHVLRRGWLRRTIAEKLAAYLGCDLSSIELRRTPEAGS